MSHCDCDYDWNVDDDSRAQQHSETFHAKLAGFREVPANSTVATGGFTATIINDTTIMYELTYSGLEAPSRKLISTLTKGSQLEG